MKKLFIMLLLLLSINTSGCADSETKIVSSKNPDASEILALEKNADLFQWNNIVYIYFYLVIYLIFLPLTLLS
ncbi:hypothetical protein [Metabacillus idriensis]|uniref:hypothetical protein n=1 Tax=Metabacillus idriensis TaxID=324768 RepID=UPI00174A6EFB|nr:hypothetical protein [Metabacillus idriensis]